MFRRPLVAALALALGTPNVFADSLRYRFVPADSGGGMRQVPAGPGGAVGELRTGFAMAPQPYQHAHRATHMAPFRHPFTGRDVTVPLTLPASTPRVERRGEDVIFNYGSYFVEIRFLDDGSVETTYNSGFLRPLRLS